jgi:hypothetical protein
MAEEPLQDGARILCFAVGIGHAMPTMRTLCLIAATLIAGCTDGPRPAAMTMCSQAGAAARYIAARSQRVSDVQRVVADVIAGRQFPAVADKDVAMAGEFVILTRDRLSPEDIAAKFEQDCQVRLPN